MLVIEIITPEQIGSHVDVGSKKRALEFASNLLSTANPSINQQDIFESFLVRERLGSTALGHGVALPHGRIKSSENTIGALLQLEQGIDYDADDKQPVDLIFAMLVPEHSTDEHLKLLAQLAEMFSSDEFRKNLRAAKNVDELYKLIDTGPPDQADE